MNREEILRELQAVQKKQEGKTYHTFEINIGAMAKDCADTIKELIIELDNLKAERDSLVEFAKSIDPPDGDLYFRHYSNGGFVDSTTIFKKLDEMPLDPMTFNGVFSAGLSSSEEVTANGIAESQHQHNLENLRKMKEDIGMIPREKLREQLREDICE